MVACMLASSPFKCKLLDAGKKPVTAAEPLLLNAGIKWSIIVVLHYDRGCHMVLLCLDTSCKILLERVMTTIKMMTLYQTCIFQLYAVVSRCSG